MADEPTISPEEAELLSKEEDLRAKPEEDRSDEEAQDLVKIDELKDDFKTRFKTEKETPSETDIEKKSLLAQKKHHREKRKKAEEDSEKSKKDLEDYKKAHPGEVKKEEDGKGWKEKIDFLTTHKDYSQDEFAFLTVIAKGKGVPLEEAEKSDEFKDWLAPHREKVERETSTPAPSSRTVKVGKKELKDLSKEELEENYPEVVQKILGERKRKSTI